MSSWKICTTCGHAESLKARIVVELLMLIASVTLSVSVFSWLIYDSVVEVDYQNSLLQSEVEHLRAIIGAEDVTPLDVEADDE